MKNYIESRPFLDNLRSVIRNIYKGIQKADLDDIVQTTILKALQKSKTPAASNKNLKAWINTIAKNIIMDEFKIKKRGRERGVVDDMAKIESVADSKPSAKEQIIGVEEEYETYWALNQQALNIIEKLEANEREVMKLVLQGKKAKEIGEAVGTTEGNVRVIIFRAKQKLKGMLKQN